MRSLSRRRRIEEAAVVEFRHFGNGAQPAVGHADEEVVAVQGEMDSHGRGIGTGVAYRVGDQLPVR
ncbi:hypothetical protein [Streptomyces sp. NPDC001340]